MRRLTLPTPEEYLMQVRLLKMNDPTADHYNILTQLRKSIMQFRKIWTLIWLLVRTLPVKTVRNNYFSQLWDTFCEFIVTTWTMLVVIKDKLHQIRLC